SALGPREAASEHLAGGCRRHPDSGPDHYLLHSLKTMHRILACLALLASPVAALEANVTIAIPRLEVAEYHRPYVAAWIEKPDGKVTANLTVWYDVAMKDGEGET